MQTMPISCDVVVVGAGLTGALVARQLAEANLSVAILEATEQSGGSAAKSVGLALLGMPEPFTVLSARLGAETAQQLWGLTRENLTLLSATCARLGVPVAEVGSFRPTHSAEEAHALQASVDALAAQDFAVTLEDATDWGFLVGMQTAGDLAFDPVALTQALLNYPGLALHTNTAVQQIVPCEEDLEIWAHKHYIRTKAVVLAAGAHVVHLNRRLGASVSPLALQSARLPAPNGYPTPLALRQGQVIVHEQAGEWHMVAWATGEDAEARQQLAETAAEFAPEAALGKRQATWVAQSRDGLPVVGELPDLPRIYTVSGLGPWGLSWVGIAAEQLLALMLHDHPPAACFAPQRFADAE